MFFAACAITALCYLAGKKDITFLLVLLAVVVIYGLVYRHRYKLLRQIEHEEKRLMRGYNPDARTEQAVWLNGVLHRAWQFMAPILESNISKTVEGILNYSKPGIVKSFTFKEFYLGRAGPCVDDILMHAQSDLDVLRQDMKIEFIQPDSRIKLAVKLNNIIVGLPKPVVNVEIKDITFRGLLTVDAKLHNVFPFAEILKVGFRERPEVKLDIKPLGVEITALPWLGEWIYSAIESAVQANMVDQALEINLDAILNPKRELSAAGLCDGVLLVDILDGVNIPKVERGTVDPYVRVTVDTQIKSTRTVPRSINPTWNTTIRFLVHSVADTSIRVEIFDKSSYGADKSVMHWDIGPEMIGHAIHAEEKEPVMLPFDGLVEPGHLRISVQYFAAPELPIAVQQGLGLLEESEGAGDAVAISPASGLQEMPVPLPITSLVNEPPAKSPLISTPTPNTSLTPTAPPKSPTASQLTENSVMDMHFGPGDVSLEQEIWQTGLLLVHILGAKKLRSPSKAQYLQPYITVHVMNKNVEYVDRRDKKKEKDEKKDEAEEEKEKVDSGVGVKVYRTKQQTGPEVTFDELCEVIVTSRDQDKITLRCKNKLVAGVERLGDVIINLGTYMRVTNVLPMQWLKFSDAPGNGRVQLSLYFINMDMGHSLGYVTDALVEPKTKKAHMELAKRLGATGEMGKLTITIHEGRKLEAADRGRSSDPFVTVRIKKVKVAQTRVIMETLSPVWDETFTVPLPDVKGIYALFEVWDWDRLTQPDPLGQIWVDLDTMVPDEFGQPYLSRWLPLDKAKTGLLHVTMFFQPPGCDPQKRVLRKSPANMPAITAGAEGPLHMAPAAGVSTGSLFDATLPAVRHSSDSRLTPNNGAMSPTFQRTISSTSSRSRDSDSRRSSLKKGGSTGGRAHMLHVVAMECRGLPTTDFHPFIKVKVNDKTVATSAHMKPAALVHFDFATSVILNTNISDGILNIVVADGGGRNRMIGSKPEYVTETPLSLAKIAQAPDVSEYDGTIQSRVDMTVTLAPNSKAESMFGPGKLQLELGVTVSERANL